MNARCGEKEREGAIRKCGAPNGLGGRGEKESAAEGKARCGGKEREGAIRKCWAPNGLGGRGEKESGAKGTGSEVEARKNRPLKEGSMRGKREGGGHK